MGISIIGRISSAYLIQSNIELSDEKQKLVDKLMKRIDASLQAQKSKYLRLNVSKIDLDKVVDLLPGISTATILPLSDPSMLSVHAVINKQDSWELLESLKENGAEGILISNIEKVLL